MCSQEPPERAIAWGTYPSWGKIGTMRNITVLSGGMGGARFLQGLLHGIGSGTLPGVSPDARVTVVANTADDLWVHGLKVCPDLDTVMYTLGDGIDPERGWGRRDETWSVRTELAEYGVEPTWFGLGDRDVATHLVRTQMLDAGYPLSQVTEALCRRWLDPVWGAGVRLLPMTDDRVETHVAIADPDSPSGRRVVHFQEYWVRLRAEVPAETVVVVGLDESTPGPGVIDAITDADLVVLPPSNPVVSVGTTLGVEVSAAGVGLHYGARSAGGVLDGWLVADVDADQVDRVTAGGLACRAVPLMMTDVDATAAMAAAAIELVAR